MEVRYLTDTHAHLCDSLFDPDRPEVLERARRVGVVTVIAVGENLADARKNLWLSTRHPGLKPAAGLYPSHLDLQAAEETAGFIREQRSRLWAVGEVGLDYWVVEQEPEREVQREIFRLFIDLARELGLPLNVHSRSAGRPAIELLLERGARRVQLHAFDGRAATASPAVEAGFFFSIPPSVVRSRQKQKLVRQLPLAALLVESDSPVLGPVSRERNEPANVPLALQAIAEIKGLSVELVAEAVRENTRVLYGDLEAERPGPAERS